MPAFTDAELAAEREREAEGVAAPTVLMRAAALGDAARVRALLAAGAAAESDERSFFGMTALMHASAAGSGDAVCALLEAGASVNAQDVDGWSPLHFAAHHGKVESARALLQAGARPSLANRNGVVAADVAAAIGAAKLAAMLAGDASSW